jgi:hypothetical protein
MSHTPGPWTIQPAETGWNIILGHELVAFVPFSAKTDARLIAAAPDLLAALEAAENAGNWDPTSRNPAHHELHAEVVGLRRAAIAKAKGER